MVPPILHVCRPRPTLVVIPHHEVQCASSGESNLDHNPASNKVEQKKLARPPGVHMRAWSYHHTRDDLAHSVLHRRERLASQLDGRIEMDGCAGLGYKTTVGIGDAGRSVRRCSRSCSSSSPGSIRYPCGHPRRCKGGAAAPHPRFLALGSLSTKVASFRVLRFWK